MPLYDWTSARLCGRGLVVMTVGAYAMGNASLLPPPCWEAIWLASCDAKKQDLVEFILKAPRSWRAVPPISFGIQYQVKTKSAKAEHNTDTLVQNSCMLRENNFKDWVGQKIATHMMLNHRLSFVSFNSQWQESITKVTEEGAVGYQYFLIRITQITDRSDIESMNAWVSICTLLVLFQLPF